MSYISAANRHRSISIQICGVGSEVRIHHFLWEHCYSLKSVTL